MLNQCVLVGRVKEIPEVQITPKGTVVAHMLVEMERSFRNDDGVVEYDVFKVTLWKGIAEECAAACTKGSIVAVKGRLRSDEVVRNERTYYNYEVIAEKVSVISAR